MKAIKIEAKNNEAIDAALKAVNGRATQHTFSDHSEIDYLVRCADAELARIGLPKTMHVGAKFQAMSGEPVSNAYAKKAFTRRATYVVLERRSTGWFLVAVESKDIWQQLGGTKRLALTQAQHDEAMARFCATLHLAA